MRQWKVSRKLPFQRRVRPTPVNVYVRVHKRQLTLYEYVVPSVHVPRVKVTSITTPSSKVKVDVDPLPDQTDHMNVSPQDQHTNISPQDQHVNILPTRSPGRSPTKKRRKITTKSTQDQHKRDRPSPDQQQTHHHKINTADRPMQDQHKTDIATTKSTQDRPIQDASKLSHKLGTHIGRPKKRDAYTALSPD